MCSCMNITTTKENDDMDEYEIELLNMSFEEMDKIANGEEDGENITV